MWKANCSAITDTKIYVKFCVIGSMQRTQKKKKKPFEQAMGVRSQQHKKDHHQSIVALSFSEWGQGDIWSSTFHLIATAMTYLQAV